MVHRLLGAGLVIFSATLALAAEPVDILARAKAASGGAAWDTIESAHTRVTLTIGGLSGTAESLDDVRKPRFVDRFELEQGAISYDPHTAFLLHDKEPSAAISGVGNVHWQIEAPHSSCQQDLGPVRLIGPCLCQWPGSNQFCQEHPHGYDHPDCD